MSYLARLKAIESKNAPLGEPSKQTKGGSDGFVGSSSGPYSEFRDRYARTREATPAEEAEIRRLLPLLLRGDPHPDFPEALALALANVDVHLEGLRASARAEGLI